MSCKKIYPLQFQRLKGRYKFFESSPFAGNPGLLCVKCNDVLVEPRQLECGCRFCYSCVKDYINDCQKYCPGCNNITESIKKNIIHDKAVEKEIFELRIKCINNDCKHICKLRHLVDHLEKCEQREAQCNSCGELYFYEKESEHKSIACKMIIMKCNDCGEEMTKKDYEENHRNVKSVHLLCNNWNGVCPNECSDQVQDNIKIHLLHCPHTIVECALAQVGCTKMVRKIDMEDHMRTDALSHMTLMMEEINKLKSEKEKVKLEYSESTKKLNLECNELRQSISTSSSLIDYLKEKVKLCHDRTSRLQNEATNFKQSLNSRPSSKIVSDCLPSSSRSSFFDFQWKIDKIIDKIKEAQNGINVSLLSDSFYTGIPGYNMCLKMYPNGDGNDSGKFISLYFVIMKGDYDDQVSWPFTNKLSISMLSNKFGNNQCTVNMKPDINERCYGRPSTTFNLAAGQPQFISHKELMSTDGYINNDSIVVRIKFF